MLYLELLSRKKIYQTDLKNLDYSHLPVDINYPRQIVWHLANNIIDIPKCQNEKCSNKVKWNNQMKEYRTFCSNKCHNSSIRTKTKKKQTNLQRYGVEVPAKSDIIKEKMKQTNINRYGVEHTLQVPEIRQQIKQTNKERYGVENPMQAEIIKRKGQKTKFRKYGNVTYNNREKVIQTSIDRYSTLHPNQKHFPIKTAEILLDENDFTQFMKDKTIFQASRLFEIDISTTQRYIKKYNVTDYIQNKSYLENEMKVILEEIGINFIQNTRKIIAPYELDFYLPDHQVAIEMNGDYWHSDKHLLETRGMTADEYHQMKTDRCQELGIELIHISESEWLNGTNL